MSVCKYIELRDVREVVEKRDRAIALGFFDGIHIGHRKLIEKTVEVAKEREMTSAVLSFLDFPRKGARTILDNDRRLEILSKLGVEEFIVIPFEDNIKEMSAASFVDDVLVDELCARALVAGFDYSFGARKEGDINRLFELASRYDIDVYRVSEVIFDSRKVSSTWIRELISEGDLILASKLLGDVKFSIKGKVIVGKRLGSSLGFPTANIRIPDGILLPRFGVYRSLVMIQGEEYKAISNIGVRPTVEDSEIANCETYIYNFDKEIYGQDIEVILLEYVRDEMRFDSYEDLAAQVVRDREAVSRMWETKLPN